MITVSTILLILLLAGNVLTLVLLRSSRFIAAGATGRPAQPGPAFASLREQGQDVSHALHQASGQLNDAGAKLALLQKGWEQLSVAAWAARSSLEQQHFRLANDLFSILDIRQAVQEGIVSTAPGQTLEIVFRRLRESFEDAGITSIDVTPGAQFSGELHNSVRECHCEQPARSIVKVVRAGYMLASGATGSVVLRPADVVVSLGPASPSPIAETVLASPTARPASAATATAGDVDGSNPAGTAEPVDSAKVYK